MYVYKKLKEKRNRKKFQTNTLKKTDFGGCS